MFFLKIINRSIEALTNVRKPSNLDRNYHYISANEKDLEVEVYIKIDKMINNLTQRHS